MLLWFNAWRNGRIFKWVSEEANQRVLDSAFTRLALVTSPQMGRKMAFEVFQKAYETGDLLLVTRVVKLDKDKHLPEVSSDEEGTIH